MSKPLNVKIPDKIGSIFDGPADYRGAYGGRGGAKTIAFANMAIVDIMQLADGGKPWRFLCGRELQKSLKDSVFSVIAGQIEEMGVQSAFEVGKEFIRCKNGNEFLFYGLRTNIAEVKGLHGVRRTWLEEAQKVSQSSLTYLIPTVMRDFPDCELWASWNPEYDDDPVHKMFTTDADDTFKVAKVNWYDNPWFPASLDKVRLRDQKNNPDAYDWIWNGNFNTSATGAVYAKWINAARDDGRICRVPYDPSCEVFTAWDLGWGDATSIWFLQFVGRELRWLDYYEASGEPLSHYVQLVKSKPYNYSMHYLPHDGGHGNIRGESVTNQLDGMGLRNQVLTRETDINPGIDLLRQTIEFSVFDAEKCKDALKSLTKHAYEWDDVRGIFKSKPRHDWTSHCADAARYAAIAAGQIKGELFVEAKKPMIYSRPMSNGWMG